MKTKGARYSTFKESPIPGSWTTGNIAQRFASSCLLACCCGCCYTGRKTGSSSGSNEDEEIPKSAIGSPSNSAKSGNGVELAMEEISLTDQDHGASDNDGTRDVTEDDAFLMNDKNESLPDTSDSKSGGMRRAIGSLPVLPRKEKKSPSFNDCKNVSESDSEMGYPASLFAKCSERYRQRRALNIPQLIIS